MRIIKCLAVICIIASLISCGEKFDGKNEKNFKISKAKIEKGLDAEEKINLEKALRVVALQAMSLKWEESEKYTGKSFNTISLELIDGLSYSSVIDLAEDMLKKRNKKEIAKINKEIDTLNKQSREISLLQKKLDLFKIDSVAINNTEWFGGMVPELEISYKYIGKADLKGPVAISYDLKQKSTSEVVASQSSEQGNSESVITPGESITESIILREYKEKNPKLWSAVKFPVTNPNLSDYDLEMKVGVLSLFLNGKKFEMPKVNIKEVEKEIKTKKSTLEELQKVKGTLDELELTSK